MAEMSSPNGLAVAQAVGFPFRDFEIREPIPAIHLRLLTTFLAGVACPVPRTLEKGYF
jgi:hypothetical protein